MNELAQHGRNWALRIGASAVLVSLYNIVTYNLVMDEVSTKKLIQQVIRFVLTLVLMYQAFRGKRWAAVLTSVLFVLAASGSVHYLVGDLPLPAKVPFAVMLIVYGVGAYHFSFAESFQEYRRHLDRLV